jgi:hypothetical protein
MLLKIPPICLEEKVWWARGRRLNRQGGAGWRRGAELSSRSLVLGSLVCWTRCEGLVLAGLVWGRHPNRIIVLGKRDGGERLTEVIVR